MSKIRPDFIETTEETLHKYGVELRSIIGLPLVAGWIAWDNTHNEWFSDDAVILQFGDHCLEACFKQMSQLAITWNTVDVSLQPNWLGCWDGMDLTWRQNAHPTFKTVIGKDLFDISIVSYDFRTKIISDRTHPEHVGREQVSRLLHALEFRFKDSNLVLYNALDENGLQNELLTGAEFAKLSLQAL